MWTFLDPGWQLDKSYKRRIFVMKLSEELLDLQKVRKMLLGDQDTLHTSSFMFPAANSCTENTSIAKNATELSFLPNIDDNIRDTWLLWEMFVGSRPQHL